MTIQISNRTTLESVEDVVSQILADVVDGSQIVLVDKLVLLEMANILDSPKTSAALAICAAPSGPLSRGVMFSYSQSVKEWCLEHLPDISIIVLDKDDTKTIENNEVPTMSTIIPEVPQSRLNGRGNLHGF